MRVAYILPPSVIVSGVSNGVRVQAESWKSGIEALGVDVVTIDVWGNYDWKSFDIIHIFGYGIWLDEFLPSIFERTTAKIICSPIIDAVRSCWLSRIATYCEFPFFRMYSSWGRLKKSDKYIHTYLVRSEFEKQYLLQTLKITQERIVLQPLSYRIMPTANIHSKEDFCLHVSLLSNDRKNVKRLVESAIKYKYKLVLAGNYGSPAFLKELQKLIGNNSNVEILGFVSEEKLKELYERAKAFALPSIYGEGVGLVALEAAVYGCDIVITNIGGPKEYYSNLAYIINPYSIDEIGQSVFDILNGKTFQPQLREHIMKNYNVDVLNHRLLEIYKRIMKISV